MSIVSTTGAQPASSNAIVDAVSSQWTLGSLLTCAIVILIGIAAGGLIGVLIGLANGWIEIQIC